MSSLNAQQSLIVRSTNLSVSTALVSAACDLQARLHSAQQRRAQGVGQPRPVLLDVPAARSAQQRVHLGRAEREEHVRGVLDAHPVPEQAARAQALGDGAGVLSGRAGVLVREAPHVLVGARGLDRRHEQTAGPFEYVGAESDHVLEDQVGVGTPVRDLPSRRDGGVTGPGDRVVECFTEQFRLAAGERREHRPDRDPGLVGDLLDRGAHVAVADEEPRPRGTDGGAGATSGFFPKRGLVRPLPGVLGHREQP